ncbi:MAG: heme-binding protein [Spirochaetaceae bacterium]|nr:heme-binding protein [Spirochaetaceae bacterium]HPG26065.1 heme-binding protein [Myxococcota bacterium]
MKKSAPRATLSTEAIETLLSTAIARARELDIRVHIAITDSAAEIVGFVSCEGAPRIAATTARHKAFTAVQTGMPTKDWKTYLDGIPADELKIIDKIDGYIAADGGYPIVENGLVLGAIGVSGADQQRDADVALRAMAALDA